MEYKGTKINITLQNFRRGNILFENMNILVLIFILHKELNGFCMHDVLSFLLEDNN
jgi:hypothetical protein